MKSDLSVLRSVCSTLFLKKNVNEVWHYWCSKQADWERKCVQEPVKNLLLWQIPEHAISVHVEGACENEIVLFWSGIDFFHCDVASCSVTVWIHRNNSVLDMETLTFLMARCFQEYSVMKKSHKSVDSLSKINRFKWLFWLIPHGWYIIPLEFYIMTYNCVSFPFVNARSDWPLNSWLRITCNNNRVTSWWWFNRH